MKANVKAFAALCGTAVGIITFLSTWWIIAANGQSTEPNFLGIFYRGYEFTPVGSIIGLAYGLVHGTILGGILAAGYNFFQNKFES